MEKNYFGVMLDCSRNAVMKVDALKKFIDDLVLMGYNMIELYTEDTYEIEGEPLFGHFRGRYSINELKEIDEYASSKGVEVIPCIQTLAHLNCIFDYPYYLYNFNDTNDILLVEEEKTYELIEKMFISMRKAFKSKRINIGMDEAHFLGLGKYLDLHGYHSRFEIILKHLNKVCEIASKYDFKPMMWSDMFFRIANHGEYRGLDTEIPSWVKESVPKDVSLIYWDYYSSDNNTYGKMLDKHLGFNNEVWFAGGAWKWHGFHSGNQFSFDKTRIALEECNKRSVKNVLITMWGDNGNECQAISVYPALFYTAECYKGNYDLENAKTKFKELFNESWDDFMLCDMILPDTFNKENELFNGVKEMLYSDPLMGRLDSTVVGDGSESKFFNELSLKFLKALSKSNNKEMFDSYYALSKLMSYKYDLGYRTRILYKNKDICGLKEIIDDYDKTISLLDEFLSKFRTYWFKYNKPQGFDVQDIRMGGLKQRLIYSKDRLNKYINGSINNIEELDEETIDFFYPDDKSKRPTILNQYHLTITSNRR